MVQALLNYIYSDNIHGNFSTKSLWQLFEYAKENSVIRLQSLTYLYLEKSKNNVIDQYPSTFYQDLFAVNQSNFL